MTSNSTSWGVGPQAPDQVVASLGAVFLVLGIVAYERFNVAKHASRARKARVKSALKAPVRKDSSSRDLQSLLIKNSGTKVLKIEDKEAEVKTADMYSFVDLRLEADFREWRFETRLDEFMHSVSGELFFSGTDSLYLFAVSMKALRGR